MHENAWLLFQDRALRHIPLHGRVLEVGPDRLPSTLQELSADRTTHWDTVDLHSGPGIGPVTHTMTDPNVLPIPDDEYDAVVSSSVLEHVRHPWLWFPELARVVRPGGLVVTIAPVSWPEHKGPGVPFDCWRVLPDGMRVLAELAGLDVEDLVHTSLEPAARRRWYPGESYRFLQAPRPVLVERATSSIDRVLRRPRSAAVDCILVARKPAAEAQDPRHSPSSRSGP